MPTIGIIGTGIQGTAIVDKLCANNISVGMYDHMEAEMAKSIELGGIPYYSAEELLRECSLVCLILPAGGSPLELFSKASIQNALHSRHIIVQMGTTSVDTAHRLHQIVAKHKASFVECVIGGPIIMIQEGDCPLFFAGPQHLFTYLQQLFFSFGAIINLGEVGQASAFNLASLAHVYAVVHGFSLASAMMERSKIDLDVWLDFVNNGIAGHPGEFLTTFLWPAHLEGRTYGLIGPAQVKNDGAQQEAKLIAQQARLLQLDTGLVNAVQNLHNKAIQKGKELDWSSFFDYLAPVQIQYTDTTEHEVLQRSKSAPVAAFKATERLKALDIYGLLQVLPSSAIGLKVKEGMKHDGPVAYLDMDLQQVSELLQRSSFSDIPVLERGTDRFLGIVSEGDLLRVILPDFSEVLSMEKTLQNASTFLLDNAQKIAKQSISSIVIANPITLHPEQDILSAAVIMVEKMIRRLPVVKDGRYIACISRADICWIVMHQENK